jgi:hypothetical protein
MSASEGKAILQGAQKVAVQASKGSGAPISPDTDSQLMAKSHDRGYNPVNEAKRGSISSELNADAGRYQKGPGPL